MDGLNLVLLIGTVGKDAEVTDLQSGSKIAKFSLATNKTYKTKDGEKRSETQWHNIECWNGIAGMAGDWIRKGTNLFLLGEVKTESWIDKKSGDTKYSTKVVATKVTLLPGNKPHPVGAPVADADTVVAEVAGAVVGAVAGAAVANVVANAPATTAPATTAPVATPAAAQAQTEAYTAAEVKATNTDDLPF